MTPAERSLRGRIGAFRLHSSGGTNTAPARRAFDARFYQGIPDDLPNDERQRRAGYARKAYFAQLAFRSARNRAKKATTVFETPVVAKEARRATDERPSQG